MFAPGPTTAARPGESLERALVASVGMLSAVLAMTSGLVLLVRRAGGGFETVSGGGLVAAAVLGGTLVLACDAAAGASGLRSAWRIVARAGYVLALGALALPPRFGAPLDGWAFVAAAVLAGGFVARPLGPRPAGRWLPSLRIPSSRRLRAESPSDRQPAAGNSLAGGCPGRVAQRFERYELDGMDCVRGTLVLAVPPGARSAHGHVGFCPSFRQVPVVEVVTEYDGVEAVVTAAEVVPWGVRVECRLDEPAEESVEIPVDVVARAPA